MAEVAYVQATRIYPGTNTPAINRLDLNISDGEFMVLVGPSGSGKTTALRMLAGLEDIDEGEVQIGGKDVSNKPPKDRDIAMVFQNYALYPHMTVADNMGFALKLKGVPKAERMQRVREAARMLDLENFLDRKPKALSGGQRQRVAMGRAIVREPAVFLMDEPLSNLDAKLRVETRANIAALQTRLGTTTVYVTHDQTEAMTMGDRVAVLSDGLLQQCDTPRALYEHPNNAFVAGFIGSPAMNLKTVPLANGGAQMGATSVPLPKAVLDDAGKANLREVLIGVRPEGYEITSDPSGIPLKVDLVEELGADAYLYGTTDLGDEERFTVRVGGRTPPSMGSTVRLTVNPDGVHVFNPESGERLGG